MKTLKQFILEREEACTLFTPKQIEDLEKFADRLLQKHDIDIEFTRHFADRMSDKRNDPCISMAELQRLFKKISRDKGNKIKQLGDDTGVIVDLQKDLNLPFVIKIKGEDMQVVMKTIMRKKNFTSSTPKINY